MIAAAEGRTAIDTETMQNGLDLMRYYFAEWMDLALRLEAHHKDVSEPKRLWQVLEKRRDEKDQHTFTVRDISNNGPQHYRNRADHVRQLLGELIRRGYVRMTGSQYEIRPADKC